MCSDGFLGLIREGYCQLGIRVFWWLTLHNGDSQFGVLLQDFSCQVQDLWVVCLPDEVLVVELLILQAAVMMDKLDALCSKVEVILVAGHICNQNRVILLGSLHRRVGWSTVRIMSMCFPPSTHFISKHDSPSEYHWGEWWYEVLSAVGDVGLNLFTCGRLHYCSASHRSRLSMQFLRRQSGEHEMSFLSGMPHIFARNRGSRKLIAAEGH